jgi:hypothetical protein
MHIMNRNLIWIFTILLSSVHAQDADKPASAAKKDTKRQAWILATSLPDAIESPLNILAGGKVSELKISKRTVGAQMDVPQDGIIQVVKSPDPEQGKASPVVLASVKIPEEFKDSLIILVPDATLNPPLIFKSHIVDLNRFPNGHGLFVNLTAYEIGVVVGDRLTSVLPDQYGIVQISGLEGMKSLSISYKYRMPKDEDWNLISASSISQNQSTREILIFSYDKELSQIGYHGMNFNINE